MTLKNKLFTALSVILIIFSFSLAAEAGEKSQAVTESLSDPDGRIIGISSKGAWGEEYPENSLEAIKAAALTGIDAVMVDVKKTSDNVLILFSDDSTERMLAGDTVYNISETDYSTLGLYFLKKGSGGGNRQAGDCKIPTLKDALLLSVEEDFPLVLRADASLLPEISLLISECGAENSCAVMMRNKAKDIENAVSLSENPPLIIGTVRGNVIFSVASFVNRMKDMGSVGAELKSTNRYGINYQHMVLDSYKGIRLVANPTESNECGARRDTEKWWNDLISRGYSVIITDYPQLFTEYLERTDKARLRLQEAYDKNVTAFTLPEFGNEHLNDYKKAYTDAVSLSEKLLSDKASSVQELNDAYLDLMKASNEININYDSLTDGTAGTTITLPRILLCILAAVAVIAVQVFFYRKRRKKEG